MVDAPLPPLPDSARRIPLSLQGSQSSMADAPLPPLPSEAGLPSTPADSTTGASGEPPVVPPTPKPRKSMTGGSPTKVAPTDEEPPEFGDEYNDEEEEDEEEGIYVSLPMIRMQAGNRLSVISTTSNSSTATTASTASGAAAAGSQHASDTDRQSIISTSSVASSAAAGPHELHDLMAKAIQHRNSQEPRKVVNVKSVELQQRTQKGFLHKRGGKLGNKGWDRRWFVFEQGLLKYFKDEKDKKPQGIIPLNTMESVVFTPTPKGERHANRFELKTLERTYFLSADSSQELTEWLMLLGALIQTFKPSEDDTSVEPNPPKPPKKRRRGKK